MLKHYLEKIPCKKQLKYLLSIGKNETLAKIGTLLENSSLPPLDFYLSQLAEITRKQIDMYTYFSDKWDEALGPLDRLLHFDFKTILPECYMVKTDIMSMHFGLETRSPFLDHEVVEFVSRLPERYKASLFEDKIILKSIATNLLPKECISRKKQGFNVPLYSWFKKNKRFLIDAFETDSNLYTFVSKKEVMKLTNDFYDSPEMGHRTYKLWSLLVFHLWSLSTKQ